MTSDARVTLPLYDPPELHWANDRLWACIANELRARGIDAPVTLDRTASWNDPELMFTQICGRPLVTTYAERFVPIAAPVFMFEGCEEGRYSSVLVARLGATPNLASARLAVNDWHSHSGWSALVELLSGLEGRAVMITGSHAASMDAIREGEADAAAIDAVTWGLLQRHRGDACVGLSVLARSTRVSAPPYAVARAEDRQQFLHALYSAMRDPNSAEARHALGLRGVQTVTEDAYRAVGRFAAAAPPRAHVPMSR